MEDTSEVSPANCNVVTCVIVVHFFYEEHRRGERGRGYRGQCSGKPHQLCDRGHLSLPVDVWFLPMVEKSTILQSKQTLQ